MQPRSQGPARLHNAVQALDEVILMSGLPDRGSLVGLLNSRGGEVLMYRIAIPTCIKNLRRGLPGFLGDPPWLNISIKLSHA